MCPAQVRHPHGSCTARYVCSLSGFPLRLSSALACAAAVEGSSLLGANPNLPLPPRLFRGCLRLRRRHSGRSKLFLPEELGCVWFPHSVSYSAVRAAEAAATPGSLPSLLQPGQLALFLEEPTYWRLQLVAMVIRLGGYNVLVRLVVRRLVVRWLVVGGWVAGSPWRRLVVTRRRVVGAGTG